uniref:Uncharacterized protein n=1 Tax=Tanacetum cinerariifolium TaxID=118510 RepID=A0A6L2NK30_TANCI|nr:hypothetical protein [Tanacetum cinerariifolium]
MAKHQRYLAGEEGSDPDSPTPKPAKANKKSKPSSPKADLRPPVTKPASSQQPKSKPAPAKSPEKKHKLVTETSDKPSLAKRSKPGLATKPHKPTSSLRLVDEFVDECILEKEPRFNDEEADIQRAVEESLNSVHDAPRGSLLPVVIRKPDSGKFQSLTEVRGKRKEKRRTPASTEPSGHAESHSIYAELGLTDSNSKFDKEVPSVVKVGAQDEGHVAPNLGVLTKGQAGSNPGDDAKPQHQSSPIVHVGPNLEHMDLEATDVSTQLHPEPMDEGFTATAYPNVQEILKLTVKEQVILEEPTSSTRTLSSLQHLAKDFSFGDLFFNDKPSKAENEKTTSKTKAESMGSVTIQQDTSTIPPMTTSRIGELEQIMANLIQDNEHLEERLDSHRPRLYTLENLDISQHVSKAVDEIVTDAVDWAIQALLWNRFRDLPEADMKEILHQRMWETNSYKAHKDHIMLYEALDKSINRYHTDELLTDLVEARKKKKKRHDSPKTPPRSPPHQPPPPPLPAGPFGTSRSPRASRSSQLPLPPSPPSTSQNDQSKSTVAPSSSKTAASAKYAAWTITNTRLRPSVS